MSLESNVLPCTRFTTAFDAPVLRKGIFPMAQLAQRRNGQLPFWRDLLIAAPLQFAPLIEGKS
jgi:hypothetical protein